MFIGVVCCHIGVYCICDVRAGNSIEVDGATSLSHCLPHLTHLTVLYLSGAFVFFRCYVMLHWCVIVVIVLLCEYSQ